MSNDNSAASDDLSLDLEDGDANDSSADDAERTEDSDESEDEGENLDLDPDKDGDDDKAAKREAATAQHAKTWFAKIASGKATYDDVPTSLKYLIPNIKALFKKAAGEEISDKKEKQPKLTNAEVMTIVRFETLKGQVHKANRTSEQNQILNSEFKLLISKGFDPETALKRAVKEADVDLDEPAEMPRIKTGSGASIREKANYTGLEDPNKMSRKELARFNSSHPRR